MARDIVFGKAHDCIDADYVIVAPESREPTNTKTPEFAETFAARSGMEMLRSRSFVETSDPGRSGILFWSAGLIAAATAFWVSGGHVLLNTSTGTAVTSPTQQMRIAGWNSKVVESGVNPTLMIDGEVVNEGLRTEMLPSLEIEVASANGTLTRYKLGTGDASIEAQGTFPFSGRLHLPKDGVKTVSVSFVQ